MLINWYSSPIKYSIQWMGIQLLVLIIVGKIVGVCSIIQYCSYPRGLEVLLSLPKRKAGTSLYFIYLSYNYKKKYKWVVLMLCCDSLIALNSHCRNIISLLWEIKSISCSHLFSCRSLFQIFCGVVITNNCSISQKWLLY